MTRLVTPLIAGLGLSLLLVACGDKDATDDTAGASDGGGESGSGDDGSGDDGGSGGESGGDSGESTGDSGDSGDEGGTDSGDGCDDPFPAMCGSGQTLEGDPVVLDTLAVTDGANEEEYTCAETECCLYDLAPGTYAFTGTYAGESVSEEATVDNSYACDHEVTYLTFTFDVAK